ncbi:MAG: hypothetical protein ACRD1H_16300 [Vicinamibacterales bacterium]
MLSLFRSRASSGEPSVPSNGWKSSWLLWVAVGAVALPILVAVVLTSVTGPLFGVWGWAEVALILLLAVTFGLLTLGAYRGVHNPYRWVMPGPDHWGARQPDPQSLYAGSIRSPVAADARMSSDYRPLLVAIAPALGALAMVVVVVAGQLDGADDPPQPAALPIVEVERNLSVMLEKVDLGAERLELVFRIDNLDWQSSTGYEIPGAEDLTLGGVSHEHSGVIAATYTPIHRTDKPGFNHEVAAWRLRLLLAPPADPTQPVTVTLHRLRYVPDPDISDLPETVDGEWSFTFLPEST